MEIKEVWDACTYKNSNLKGLSIIIIYCILVNVINKSFKEKKNHFLVKAYCICTLSVIIVLRNY